MAGQERCKETPDSEVPTSFPPWQLDIGEVTGHNLEPRGREEVNRRLKEGRILLHVYTLRYEEEGVWRERPMAILGRPRRNTLRGVQAADQPARADCGGAPTSQTE